MNVLADWSKTIASMAKQLEIMESRWIVMEAVVDVLKRLQFVTTVLSGDTASPASMVRPFLQ